jgi:hypothetical protein
VKIDSIGCEQTVETLTDRTSSNNNKDIITNVIMWVDKELNNDINNKQIAINDGNTQLITDKSAMNLNNRINLTTNEQCSKDVITTLDYQQSELITTSMHSSDESNTNENKNENVTTKLLVQSTQELKLKRTTTNDVKKKCNRTNRLNDQLANISQIIRTQDDNKTSNVEMVKMKMVNTNYPQGITTILGQRLNKNDEAMNVGVTCNGKPKENNCNSNIKTNFNRPITRSITQHNDLYNNKQLEINNECINIGTKRKTSVNKSMDCRSKRLNNKIVNQVNNNVNNQTSIITTWTNNSLNPGNEIESTQMNMLIDEMVVNNGCKLNVQNNNNVQLMNDGYLTANTTDLRRSSRIMNKTANKPSNTVVGLHMHTADVNISNDNKNISNTREQNQQTCDFEERKEKSLAIYKHQKDMNHRIDWINSEVVCSECNSYKLLIKESLIIKAFQPILNRTTHSVPLHIFPNGVSKQCFPKSYPH